MERRISYSPFFAQSQIKHQQFFNPETKTNVISLFHVPRDASNFKHIQRYQILAVPIEQPPRYQLSCLSLN